MLQAFRQLALDYCYQQLGNPSEQPDDLASWFRQLHPELLYPLLVEVAPHIKHTYTLQPDPQQPDVALLKIQEHSVGQETDYPFVKQPPKAPFFGAVLKRTLGKQGPAPTPSRIKQTIQKWQEIRDAGASYSPLFGRFVQLANLTQIRKEGQDTIYTMPTEGCETILDLCTQHLIDEKETVFLVLTDQGQMPGTLPEYRQFVMEHEAEARYTTLDVPLHSNGSCPLCGASPADVFAQGIKGAGFNIMNQDRASAFPGANKDNAWKRYAICITCCHLLTVAKIYVVPALQTSIAGSSAVVIPSVSQDCTHRHRFIKQIMNNYDALIHPQDNGNGGVQRLEQRFLDTLSANQQALTSISILWGNFGQEIEKIKAIIPDVLPSRLADISRINDEVPTWEHPCFPRINDKSLQIDLGMGCLYRFFSMVAIPTSGTTKTSHPDDTTAMCTFRRQILEAVFQKQQFRDVFRFENNLHQTIRQHYSLNQPNSDNFYNKEMWEKGTQPKGKALWVTASGFVKHVARLLHYLRHEQIGVLPMIEHPYVPSIPELVPFVGAESGIDTPSKAFAFWIGVLQAKVMLLQKNAGRATSLQWLQSLELHPRQLPRLFTQLANKILLYDQERQDGVMSWRSIRFPMEEISHLGIMLGDQIGLTVEQTNYFLLLGMGVANRVNWESKTKKKQPIKQEEACND